MMSKHYFLSYDKLQQLIILLQQEGFECTGPQVNDGAIVYDLIDTIEQLPWGVRDIQGRGDYQLISHDKQQAFAWANGPMAVKPKVFKTEETVYKVSRNEVGELTFQSQIKASYQALIGIRPCDLHALQIQDTVFLNSDVIDPFYQARREKLFLIVSNCSYSSANCFCLTANGHPEAKAGYDIALTEVDEGFVSEFASKKAQQLLDKLQLTLASLAQKKQAKQKIQLAVNGQVKKLSSANIKQALINNPEHPQWDDAASRCLSCGNCTQVCPTCFCHREVEKPALAGDESSHVRHWDSCFSKDHSYIHGMTVHASTKQRYRQWLTHKLATWHHQFGSSGCVGCGRCISWCPTGIDITEEVDKIMESLE